METISEMVRNLADLEVSFFECKERYGGVQPEQLSVSYAKLSWRLFDEQRT